MKVSLRRRVADALIAVATWIAAVGTALWFYDWVNRWYVVIAVVLLIVSVAMVTEKPKASKPDAERPAPLTALPRPRDGEALDEVAADVA
ncbi:MAG: hypothetical protein ACRDV3_12230 [Acidothermaceae bacterium]